jgi:hypothetical protein
MNAAANTNDITESQYRAHVADRAADQFEELCETLGLDSAYVWANRIECWCDDLVFALAKLETANHMLGLAMEGVV